MQWQKHLGTEKPFTVQDIIGQAVNIVTFHTALLNVAIGRSGHVSNERLGRWLKKVQGKIVDGLMFKESGSSGGYSLWRLTQQ